MLWDSPKKDNEHCMFMVILTPYDLNESKWLSISLINLLKSFEVIWDNFELFKSWGNKISYTIIMQHLLSFFVGSWMHWWILVKHSWLWSIRVINCVFKGQSYFSKKNIFQAKWSTSSIKFFNKGSINFTTFQPISIQCKQTQWQIISAKSCE